MQLLLTTAFVMNPSGITIGNWSLRNLNLSINSDELGKCLFSWIAEQEKFTKLCKTALLDDNCSISKFKIDGPKIIHKKVQINIQ